MDGENTNGNGVRGSDGGTQSIVIRESPGTRKLSLEVDCLSLDVALSLLERAHREIESRFRIMRAQELLVEAQNNQRIAEIAGNAMRRGPRGV